MSSKRQPRIAGEGRRPTITFRCRGALKAKIEAVASTAERSVSEEIERRLEASLEAPDLRTIIREEIEADRERQRKAVMERVTVGPYGSACANNLPGLGANYGCSLSYLNGEPKTDH